MADYFLSADDAFLRGMGVERRLLPTREAWLAQLLADHGRPDEQKDRLYVAWLLNGEAIGHSSVNRITVGEEAHFHLHLWRPELHKSGLGLEFCRRAIDLFFERLRLQRLWCEPYAENTAPNRALLKLGFEFVRRYRTVPGAINFEQDVNVYFMTRERWNALRNPHSATEVDAAARTCFHSSS